MQKQVVPARFSLPYFKHILGVPVTFADLEFVDGQLTKSLKWILENKGVEDLYLTFSLTVPCEDEGDGDGSGGDSSGALELPLKEGGADIDVTEENKREYVALAMRWTMLLAVQAELAAMMAGLFEVVPRELLRVFDYQVSAAVCAYLLLDVRPASVR